MRLIFGLGLMVLACGAMAESVSVPATVYGNAEPLNLAGELRLPKGDGPFPAVVLMHGCSGLSAAVATGLEAHAAYLNENGFAALILDSFGPRDQGDGSVCASLHALEQARRYRHADALDAAMYLRSRADIDGQNLFQMGQSAGGSVSILLAMRGASPPDKSPPFRAIAAYYPWCGAFFESGRAALAVPLIALLGAADDWTPPETCQKFAPKGAQYRFVTYPGATHSFDLDIERQTYQGHTVGGDLAATLASRAEMLAFFRKHLAAD